MIESNSRPKYSLSSSKSSDERFGDSDSVTSMIGNCQGRTEISPDLAE
jgi:hypothetical protein